MAPSSPIKTDDQRSLRQQLPGRDWVTLGIRQRKLRGTISDRQGVVGHFCTDKFVDTLTQEFMIRGRKLEGQLACFKSGLERVELILKFHVVSLR
ncbi:Uncharacterised protein [Serratia fonticola]|uniref:Uncharacterized protein n=1 Tax=Serratia fonticola TaxID=47917 RepID=A0A4U9WCX9_SERFO|nr:Uncharacterised protein [Serratia fonticola]